jgi:hypothetical protein
MSSLGGGSSKQKTTSQPWSSQVPYLQAGMQGAAGLLASPPPIYQGPGIAPMSQDTVNSFGVGRSTADQYGASSQMLTGGFQDALNSTDVANNQSYKDSLSSITTNATDNFNRNVLPGLTESYASGGAFGGSDQQLAAGTAAGDLNKGIASAGAQLATNYYGIGATRANTALSNIPGLLLGQGAQYNQLAQVGQAQDVRSQAELSDTINTFDNNANAPESALDRYIQRIQGNYGGTSSTTPVSRSNASNALLGGTGAYLAAKGANLDGAGWYGLLGGLGGLV